MEIKKYFLIYLLMINIITLFLYGRDKQIAIKKKWRIPERTLLILSVSGGALGAAIGMAIFHHKTNHVKFMVIVPASLLLWAYLILRFY